LVDLGENMVRRNVPFGVGVSVRAIQTAENENSILHDSAIRDYSDRLLEPQKNPGLKSRPYEAQHREIARTTPQKIATVLSVSTSTWLPVAWERAFAMAVIAASR
jgi:hypothetical protein